MTIEGHKADVVIVDDPTPEPEWPGPWYHGSGRIEGDVIYPASVLPSVASAAEILREQTGQDTTHVRDDRVYVTGMRGLAIMFASIHPSPWVYEVEPLGPLEPDPDYRGPEPWKASRMTTEARVLRRLRPSRVEVEHWLKVALRVGGGWPV